MPLVLTPDNLLLSRPTTELPNSLCRAVSCTNIGLGLPGADDCTSGLSGQVSMFVQDSLSLNTQRAYLKDMEHFEAWGGAIPSTDTIVANYLAFHAGVLSVATLARRLASISKAHDARGVSNPAKSELVKATLQGIKRRLGGQQRRAKPLIKEELFEVLSLMGRSPKDLRDCALLLIGFAGGFRRSELRAINLADLEFVRQGVVVTIRRSKTDQVGEGRKVGIPFGRGRWCAVTAISEWIAWAKIVDGAIFRGIDRHGRVLQRRLSSEAVSLIIKQRVAAIGRDPGSYSGHSLRAGLATSAAAAGVSSWKIRQQTGHASDAMLGRYIRDGELFTGNAAGVLL